MKRERPSTSKPSIPARKGEVVNCPPFGGLTIIYRVNSTDYGHTRRYYVGLVQIAYVRYDEYLNRFVVFLTAQDDDPNGHKFNDEDGVYKFIVEQLRAK